MKHTKVTQNVVDGKVVLQVITPPFEGCEFYYEGMKFAEQENEDGSMNMSFEYEITNDFAVAAEDHALFEGILGENLLSILEEQLAKEEVVFKGGI